MNHPPLGHVSEKTLVLASGSRIRRHLLQSAGISFMVAPADLDESAIRADLEKGTPKAKPEDVALALATAKAKHIVQDHPNSFVIGCDQVLYFENEIFEKAKTLDLARSILLRLRGQTHRLYSAAALVESGHIVWTTVTYADLTMRDFSDTFVDDYLARLGQTALESLGGYQLEGHGIQLFEHIDGDYFTVLGLPLLPLIKALREREVLLT